MTDSIVSAISRFMTPEVIGKMASAAGLDETLAQKAVGASVPAILGGLANVASKPGGARQLADAVAAQPAGILESMTHALGMSPSAADKGTNVLSSLLGNGALATIASSVSKFVGIGENSTRSLMGLLTPVLLGFLGREQKKAGLDASGLARLLTTQKDDIAAAMPFGLSNMLESRGRIGGDTSAPTQMAGAPAHRAAQDAVRSTSGVSWAYWALPLLAAIGLLWYLLPGGDATRQAAEPARTTTVDTTPVKTVSVPTKPMPPLDSRIRLHHESR